MSKDIWHITNQDENTTDVPKEEGFVVLIGHWTSCLWYGGETPEPIFWENVKRWCYLDDLLACEQELIRTRKALDVAVDALKDNLSQANFTQMLDASRFHCIRTKCESALAEIIALEQKNHFANASKKVEQKDK